MRCRADEPGGPLEAEIARTFLIQVRSRHKRNGGETSFHADPSHTKFSMEAPGCSVQPDETFLSAWSRLPTSGTRTGTARMRPRQRRPAVHSRLGSRRP